MQWGLIMARGGCRSERGLSKLEHSSAHISGQRLGPELAQHPPGPLPSFCIRRGQRNSGLKVMSLVCVPCCVTLSTALLLSGPLPSQLTNERALKRWACWSWAAWLAPDVFRSSGETGLENSTEGCHLHGWPWAIQRVDVDSRGRGRMQASDQQWPGWE